MPTMDTPKKLIVNADDFGQTEGINAGIIDAHARGIVTSTTLLATGNARDHAVRLAGAYPTLGVGVHLSYHLGKPLCPPEILTALFEGDGRPIHGTLGLWAAVTCNRRALSQLTEHFRSQIEWVLQQGIRPTHLDTHKHIHYCPAIANIVCDLARQYAIPAVRYCEDRFTRRGPIKVRLQLLAMEGLRLYSRLAIDSRRLARTDRFMGVAMTGVWTKADLLAILEHLEPGGTELMVHPGRKAGLVSDVTRLIESREQELAILTDAEIMERCRQRNIQLCNFRPLAERRSSV